MNRDSLGVEVPPPEPGVNVNHCGGCEGRLSAFQKEATYCTCGSASTRVLLVTLKAIATELRLIRELGERLEGEGLNDAMGPAGSR